MKEAENKIIPMELTMGKFVFQEGDPSNGLMYFIFKGELVVYKKGLGEIRRLKEGHFFGEMALINAETRTASVRVLSAYAKLGMIDMKTFVYLAKSNPRFLLNLVKVVAMRALRAEDKAERKNV